MTLQNRVTPFSTIGCDTALAGITHVPGAWPSNVFAARYTGAPAFCSSAIMRNVP